jgi:GNAT superfamily N-acetyltransferase
VSAGEIRTLLARAYAQDPLLTWVFPDEDTRRDSTAAWLGVTVERYLDVGEVEEVREDGMPAAVALWRRPLTTLAGPPDQLPTAFGLLRALDVPGAYLHFLAVAPGAQGRGLGGQLLDRVLARSRADGVPLRLDTTNPANLPFYESHGLTVTTEARLGPAGPRIWRLRTVVP